MSADGMDRSARGWLVRTARKNLWRVALQCDLDDLIQDGFVCWVRVAHRYGYVKDIRHRMRLFQRTFLNHINDMSKRDTLERETIILLRELEEQLDLVVEDEVATFHLSVQQAPAPIRAVLGLLATETGRMALQTPYGLNAEGQRETFNQRLCRLCGYNPRSIDLPTLIYNYFHQCLLERS